MKMNLGCGYDLKDGWFNTNHAAHQKVEGAWILDARDEDPAMNGKFDFILVNHVLCTMPYNDVRKVLANIHNWLQPEGKVQIIDMDLGKAAQAWVDKNQDAIPVNERNLDWNFCMHVAGYSTRPSLFTASVMRDLLVEAGFNKFVIRDDSEYDTRPLESFTIEATK